MIIEATLSDPIAPCRVSYDKLVKGNGSDYEEFKSTHVDNLNKGNTEFLPQTLVTGSSSTK